MKKKLHSIVAVLAVAAFLGGCCPMHYRGCEGKAQTPCSKHRRGASDHPCSKGAKGERPCQKTCQKPCCADKTSPQSQK